MSIFFIDIIINATMNKIMQLPVLRRGGGGGVLEVAL